tara:strand:+ start:6129 stop:6557 length:429 start_codon:yes stop_codon:yes gene_type:complete
MKYLLTLTVIAVLGFAVVGCNKSKKINAATASSSCSASADACCGSDACSTDVKAQPAAAGANDSCCPSMKKMGKMTKTMPAAAGANDSCCPSMKKMGKMTKTMPAAAGASDPAGCGDMKDCDKMGWDKKGAMPVGCPMSGGQ